MQFRNNKSYNNYIEERGAIKCKTEAPCESSKNIIFQVAPVKNYVANRKP